MTLQKVARESFVYTLSAALTRAILFLIIPLYVAYLSPDDFGLVNLFQMYVGFGTVFILLGLDQAIIRFFPVSDEEAKQSYFSSAILVVVITALFMTGVFLFFHKFWSLKLFDNRLVGKQIWWLVSILLAESLYVFIVAAYKASREVTQLLFLNVLKFSSFLASNVVCLHFFHFKVQGVLFSFLLCDVVTILAAFRVWRYLKISTFNLSFLKELLRYGLPLAPNIVFALLLFQADHYLLKVYCGLTVVGYYAFGYKIGSALIYLLWIVNNAWMPHLFGLKEEEIPEQLTKILMWTLFVVFSCYLVLDSVARLLGTHILPESYWPSLPIITWVGMAYLVFIFSNVVDTIFNYFKKVLYIPIILAVCALLNVGLNILLIPKYEMYGAVWATVISFVLAAVFTLLVLHHRHWILFDWKQVTKLAMIFTFSKIWTWLPFCSDGWGVVALHGLSVILFFGTIGFVFPQYKQEFQRTLIRVFRKVFSRS